MDKLSLNAARRIAIAAQGLADPRPQGTVDRRHLRRVLGRIGLLQIDSVNVLARAHYLPLFSRLGPYAPTMLDDAAWGKPRSLFEYWAHEASLLPHDAWPLLRWRMERAGRMEGIYGGLARFMAERGDYADAIVERIRTDGPVVAADIDGNRGAGGWWGWSEAKHALEWLFWAGHITTATRRGFERVYDLPERVLPPAVMALPVPDEADAIRELLRISARALGVATSSDLRDYFRLDPDDIKRHLPDLVEAGDLIPTAVEGWPKIAYVHAEARRPRRVEARALLAPFDPLVWERARTERLFGFRYRIEIYTPAEKRIYGYYVLPFLLGDRLVARLDLKADRAASALLVQASHAEPDAPPETPAALAAELRDMAAWLGLEKITVKRSGDLAPALSAALR